MKSTYAITILKQLLDGEVMASQDMFASNTNQYFSQIKKAGIELIEIKVPNRTNKGKHKERSLENSPENVKRAEDYLKRLGGADD